METEAQSQALQPWVQESRRPREAGKDKEQTCPERLQKKQLCQHLAFSTSRPTLGLLTSRAVDNKPVLFEAMNHVVICYSRLRTLIQVLWGRINDHKSAFLTGSLVRSLCDTKFRSQGYSGKRRDHEFYVGSSSGTFSCVTLAKSPTLLGLGSPICKRRQFGGCCLRIFLAGAFWESERKQRSSLKRVNSAQCGSYSWNLLEEILLNIGTVNFYIALPLCQVLV